MGREILTLNFWAGFEKQAGALGQIGATIAGRGEAVSRLNKIRSSAPGAFKPQNLLTQIIQNPAKGLANAAAKRSATWNSPKEKLLRAAGGTMAVGTAAGYGLHKMDPDHDARRQQGLG